MILVIIVESSNQTNCVEKSRSSSIYKERRIEITGKYRRRFMSKSFLYIAV